MTSPPYRLDPALASFLRKQFSRSFEIPLSGPLQEDRQISRQAAAAMLTRLVKANVLKEGRGQRPKTYMLVRQSVLDISLPLEGLEEHVIWTEHVYPVLAPVASMQALAIWEYGFTEMLNNAIDHSDGTTVRVEVTLSAIDAVCKVTDDGEGIFTRIKRLCHLVDERQAILELAKGKLTTDSSRHTGEGIFFTSRVMDEFEIDANGLWFSHRFSDEENWLLEVDAREIGTEVELRLSHTPDRTLQAVFNEFAEPDEYAFSKTVVPVRLAKLPSENLVSRSQAQRLLARVDRFTTVMLDFTGVETIGQAFADEIFRVFAKAHPDVALYPTHTNEQILGMIKRAKANAR